MDNIGNAQNRPNLPRAVTPDSAGVGIRPGQPAGDIAQAPRIPDLAEPRQPNGAALRLPALAPRLAPPPLELHVAQYYDKLVWHHQFQTKILHLVP